MIRSDYLARSDEAFSAQLVNFKNTIGGYATTLGVSAASVTAQAADSDYFAYVLQVRDIMQNGARQWTRWKDIARDGGAIPAGGAPVAPVFPTTVAAVAPGIETRFRALVRQIKASGNYNSAIGAALGIEGAEQIPPDLNKIAPRLTATVTGGHVAIGWGWEGHAEFLDQCELEVDRGTGTFALLSIDTTPNYTDTQPFPSGTAKWIYRATYRVGDNRVGQWSTPVSVMVGGG